MRREPCPYHFCSAIVEVVPVPQSTSQLIRSHPIRNNALTGQCPASLMRLPMDMATYLHLHETMYNVHLRELRRWNAKQDDIQNLTRQNESQSLRGPHRLGREPEPGDDDWGLGGREDEDVIPHGEVTTGAIPPGVAGYQVGGTVSADETAGQVNAANAFLSEAQIAIKTARDKIASARGIMAVIGGENAGETISAYLTYTGTADSELASADVGCSMAQGKGDTYIGALYS
jgi:hypothetical protein